MKKIMILIVLVIVCTVSAFALGNIGISNAQETTTAGLSKKLVEVISNQEKMMQQLDDMAGQLQIVKIRATR